MDHAQTVRVVLSLAGVVALMLALAWCARRGGWLRASANHHFKLLATHNLGSTRARLALVEVEGVRLVLGVTATQVNVLHTLAGTASVPGEHFADALKRVSG